MKNLVLSAPTRSISGYGSHSRDILFSLFKSNLFNIQLVTNGWGMTSNSFNFITEELDIIDFCESNQIHQGAEDVTFIHIGIPSEFQRVCETNIGITAGLESDVIPKDWVDKCNLMNCVIVPSTFVQSVFQKCGVSVPVHVIHEGVNTDIFQPKTSDMFFDLDTEFNFLTIGQWGNPGMDRKNIEYLLAVFSEVIKRDPSIGLVIKTFMNNSSSPDAYFTEKRLKRFLNSNVRLVHGIMSEDELSSLYNSSEINSFVTFTSGEGWGRSIAEAISCDLPVIVPGWSGHMDFVNAEYSKVLPTKMIPVPSIYHHTGWFTQDSKWSMISDENIVSTILEYKNKFVEEERLKKAQTYGTIFRETFNSKETYSKLPYLIKDI